MGDKCNVRLVCGPEGSPNFCFQLEDLETGEPLDRSFIQSDWDYPSLAQSLGWSLQEVQTKGKACDHQTTDGTVQCPECGTEAGTFLAAAYDWLYEHDGDTFECHDYSSEV